jgi:hypothetical protein
MRRGGGRDGARILLVHAKHEAAKTWDMQYDFEESSTDPLHLMMLMRRASVPFRSMRSSRRLVSSPHTG